MTTVKDKIETRHRRAAKIRVATMVADYHMQMGGWGGGVKQGGALPPGLSRPVSPGSSDSAYSSYRPVSPVPIPAEAIYTVGSVTYRPISPVPLITDNGPYRSISPTPLITDNGPYRPISPTPLIMDNGPYRPISSVPVITNNGPYRPISSMPVITDNGPYRPVSPVSMITDNGPHRPVSPVSFIAGPADPVRTFTPVTSQGLDLPDHAIHSRPISSGPASVTLFRPVSPSLLSTNSVSYTESSIPDRPFVPVKQRAQFDRILHHDPLGPLTDTTSAQGTASQFSKHSIIR